MYKNMRRFLSILLVLFSLFAKGQTNLCESCALTIVDINDSERCCEVCLRKYYIDQLQQNITHGSLSKYYEREVWSTFIPLPDTLSDNFFVSKIEKKIGLYLKDSDLIECTFYLISLECANNPAIESGSSIVLVVNDSCLFKEGDCYNLSILPYFKRNQSYRVIDGEIHTIIGRSHTLFDLVYKEWLIVKLPLGYNYFFME